MDASQVRARLLQDIQRLKAPQGYLRAGWPRFFSYFSRDACIAAWQLLDLMPEVALDTIYFATSFQGIKYNWRNDEEPGKICHQAYGLGDQPCLRDFLLARLFYGPTQYYAIDATPLWLILCHRYWKKVGKAAVPAIKLLRENITSGFTWLLGRVRQDGFLVYRKRSIFAFSHQGWRDGFLDSIRIPPPVALVDVQAYTYAALCGGAELFEALFENKRYSEFLREQAEELRARFDRFWWQEESTYAFSLAGKEFRPVKRVTPDPGMCLFSGIVPEKLVPKVVSRLFQPDLWTPYGLRSLSNRDPNFRADSYHLGAVWPWQNWLIWLGLRKFGFIKEADAIQEALFKAFLALGSIPEAFAVSCDPPYKIRPIRANPVQAWSSGALLAMLAANKGE